jgi:anaerobic ribonucleoside-triphosphate reductase
MQIKFTCSEDFKEVLDNIDTKFKEIEAIDYDSLDITKRYDNYHSGLKVKGEENANIGNGKNPNNREGVIFEPIRKLNSYRFLYEQIKEDYGKDVANISLDEMLSKSLLLNDSDGSDQRYCVAMSAHYLVNKGRDFVKDVPNTNPKNYRSYIHTVIEQIMQMSNEFKGATVIYDAFLYLAFFTKPIRDYKHKTFDNYDFEEYKKIAIGELICPYKNEKYWNKKINENCKTTPEVVDFVLDYTLTNEIQGFVLILNNKYRLASQSPFVNISIFSPRVLDGQFEYFRYPNGEKIQDYLDEILKIQLIFAKFFSQGIKGKIRDVNGNLTDKKLTKLASFPVTTLAVPNDDVGSEHLLEKDKEYVGKIKRLFSKYHNINIYKGVKLAMCCRLIVEASRKSTHETEMSSLGVVTNSTSYNAVGSLRVVTLGLPSIALELKKEDRNINNYLKLLNEKTDTAIKILISQRRLIEKRTEEGFYDFEEAQGVINDKLASTIGGLGLYEAVKLLSGADWGTMYTQEELNMANEILKFIDEKCANASKETGKIFNMELSIPGESSAFRLQKRDVLNFGEEVNYTELSNQFLPATIKANLNEKLFVENELCKYIPSTTIAHLNIDANLSEEACVQLHKKIWEAYPHLSHYAFNPVSYLCEEGHLNTTVSSDGLCVECNSKIIDRSTRSIGYIRSIDNEFGKNRKDEQSRRTYYKLK